VKLFRHPGAATGGAPGLRQISAGPKGADYGSKPGLANLNSI